MNKNKTTVFSDPPQDPMYLFKEWFDTALDEEVNEPGAMALATATAEGCASNRIVQLLDIRNGGLIFTTHAGSVKGQEIAETNWSSAVLYWRELGQQMVVSGPTHHLSNDESDFLWANRNTNTHPMSVASKQSSPLQCENTLREEALKLRDSGISLLRPYAWRGYQLQFAIVEFWQAQQDRLHQRLRYEFREGGWDAVRLQP